MVGETVFEFEKGGPITGVASLCPKGKPRKKEEEEEEKKKPHCSEVKESERDEMKAHKHVLL